MEGLTTRRSLSNPRHEAFLHHDRGIEEERHLRDQDEDRIPLFVPFHPFICSPHALNELLAIDRPDRLRLLIERHVFSCPYPFSPDRGPLIKLPSLMSSSSSTCLSTTRDLVAHVVQHPNGTTKCPLFLFFFTYTHISEQVPEITSSVRRRTAAQRDRESSDHQRNWT